MNPFPPRPAITQVKENGEVVFANRSKRFYFVRKSMNEAGFISFGNA